MKPPRGAAPWLHWTTGCLNSEDLAHPLQGQAPSLREAAVEKEASAMFSLFRKTGASFVRSITCQSGWGVHVCAPVWFSNFISRLWSKSWFCQLCDLEQVHWKGQYWYTSGRQAVWWRKLRSQGLLLVKTPSMSSCGGARGAEWWAGEGSGHAWQCPLFSAPMLFRGYPATPIYKVLQQNSWLSAVKNQGRASTLSLGSWADFTEVFFKLRPCKMVRSLLGTTRGRGDGSCTAHSLCTAVSGPETRQNESSCPVARAPQGAGSMSLGWRGNACEAPGGRHSLASRWEEHHRAALEAAAWIPVPGNSTEEMDVFFSEFGSLRY